MSFATALVWSPTVDFVRQTIAEEKQLLLIVAPFIKLDALTNLVDACDDISQLQVVVRWQATDLVSGVSDVEIYPYLRDKGIPLFRHSSIHLKMLVFNHSLAFHTSGNITRKGLGLISAGNVEIGCSLHLEDGDWFNLLKLLAESLEVDENVYEQAKTYVCDNAKDPDPLSPMILKSSEDKEFSKNALPATESPEVLYQFYSAKMDPRQKMQEAAECTHDIVVYSIPSGLDEAEFYVFLGKSFKSHPFIAELVAYIQSAESIRFGAINAWITDRCSDTPRPYRHDLKTTTKHLYNWLASYYDEVTWDTPNYSMVIYWNN